MDKRQNTLGYHVCMYVHVSLMHWLICTNGIQVQSANRAWTGLILALVLQKWTHVSAYQFWYDNATELKRSGHVILH